MTISGVVRNFSRWDFKIFALSSKTPANSNPQILPLAKRLVTVQKHEKFVKSSL